MCVCVCVWCDVVYIRTQMMRRRAVEAHLGAALTSKQSSSLVQDILQGSFLHDACLPHQCSTDTL